ncbi:MAG: hypothetical protein R3B99_00550 [Polyangiales bacterium]
MDDRRLAFLLDERVLRVEGDDARTWLQGQITSDIHREAPGTSTYGLVLVGTGQVLADVWVLDLGDTFLVRSASAVFDELVARLDRYVVMEDVELEPTSLSVVHVVGDGLELGDSATVTDRVGRRASICSSRTRARRWRSWKRRVSNEATKPRSKRCVSRRHVRVWAAISA